MTGRLKFDPATDTLTTVTIAGTPPSVSGYYFKVCQNNNELYFYGHRVGKQSFLYKIDLDTSSGSEIVFTSNDDNVGYDSTKYPIVNTFMVFTIVQHFITMEIFI